MICRVPMSIDVVLATLIISPKLYSVVSMEQVINVAIPGNKGQLQNISS